MEKIKNLVVGLKVWLQSGPQLKEGTVIVIFDDRIEVGPAKWLITLARGDLHFTSAKRSRLCLRTG